MKKYFDKPWGRLIFVSILFVIIRYLSKGLSRLAGSFIESNVVEDFSYESSIYKLFMVIFSLLSMSLIPGYSWKDFGFSKPKNVNYFKIFWLTFVIVLVGTIIFGSFYMGILPKLLGDSEKAAGMEMTSGMSFVAVVLSIWIWSSISEEIYTRGLFQSLLDNLKKGKFLKLSLPVWLSGIVFGMLHLSVYSPGKLYFTLFIVTQTTILGVLAAYYREKSQSIYIAILIHILGNVYGSLLSLIGS